MKFGIGLDTANDPRPVPFTVAIAEAGGRSSGFSSSDEFINLNITLSASAQVFSESDILGINGWFSSFQQTDSLNYQVRFYSYGAGEARISVPASSITNVEGVENDASGDFVWFVENSPPPPPPPPIMDPPPPPMRSPGVAASGSPSFRPLTAKASTRRSAAQLPWPRPKRSTTFGS